MSSAESRSAKVAVPYILTLVMARKTPYIRRAVIGRKRLQQIPSLVPAKERFTEERLGMGTVPNEFGGIVLESGDGCGHEKLGSGERNMEADLRVE